MSKPRIMVGNTVVKDHETLQLQQTAENSFVFELPLSSTNQSLLRDKQLEGRNICVWVTANDGRKSFPMDTVRQVSQMQSTYKPGLIILRGI